MFGEEKPPKAREQARGVKGSKSTRGLTEVGELEIDLGNTSVCL